MQYLETALLLLLGYGIYSFGQNLGHDFDSWDAAIQSWYDEWKNYEWAAGGDGSKNGEPVQHYKQVMLINSLIP